MLFPMLNILTIYISPFRNICDLCSVQYGSFVKILDAVISPYVAQVLDEILRCYHMCRVSIVRSLHSEISSALSS